MAFPQLDWRLLSVVVMLVLGLYTVTIRKFFSDGGDWRILLPLAGVVGLLALAYFAFIYKEVSFNGSTLGVLAIALISIGLVTLLSMLVYADPATQINVAMPIMGLSIVSTAIFSIFFLGETVTLKTWAGIILALAAIFVLVK